MLGKSFFAGLSKLAEIVKSDEAKQLYSTIGQKAVEVSQDERVKDAAAKSLTLLGQLGQVAITRSIQVARDPAVQEAAAQLTSSAAAGLASAGQKAAEVVADPKVQAKTAETLDHLRSTTVKVAHFTADQLISAQLQYEELEVQREIDNLRQSVDGELDEFDRNLQARTRQLLNELPEMSVPELKATAKSLGISHSGLKKWQLRAMVAAKLNEGLSLEISSPTASTEPAPALNRPRSGSPTLVQLPAFLPGPLWERADDNTSE